MGHALGQPLFIAYAISKDARALQQQKNNPATTSTEMLNYPIDD
jgi:hypothetical protein